MKLAIIFIAAVATIAVVYWSTTTPIIAKVIAHPSAEPLAISPAHSEVTTEAPLTVAPTSEDQRESVATEKVTVESAEAVGQLFLTFIDFDTGEPIPDLRFAVFTEQPRLALIELGTSNTRGQAHVARLDNDLVLIETLHQPPHATSLAAAWLVDEQSQNLTVRVTQGGTIDGRVIDDIEQPLEDATIILKDGSHASKYWRAEGFNTDHIAQTDAKGEYSFAAVKSSGMGVWLSEGEVRPERWNKVSVGEKDHPKWERVHVDDREHVRVPDIVVDRNGIYSGTVTNARGERVEGALVSADARRWHASINSRFAVGSLRSKPGQPGFELREAETITDANGEFQLNTRPMQGHLWVWGANSSMEAFRVESLGPGESVDGIELRLSDRAEFEVELLDVMGQRVTKGRSLFEDVQMRFMPFATSPRRAIGFEFLLDDGVWHRKSGVGEGDGLIRIPIDFSLEQVQRLRIHAPGYRPIDVSSFEWLTSNDPVSFQLELLPELHIELNCPLLRDGERLQYVVVHACTLDRSTRFVHGAKGEIICCGLGTTRKVALAMSIKSAEFVLPVLESSSYDIAVSAVYGETHPYAIFGPFAPGERVHRIDLDRSFLRTAAIPPISRAKSESLPAPSVPHEEADSTGKVVLRVIDASTGQLIPGVRIMGTSKLNKEDVLNQAVRQSKGIRGGAFFVSSGAWLVQVTADGYEASNFIDIEVVRGGETALGQIKLTPHPTLFVRLRNHDGSLPLESSTVMLRSYVMGESRFARFPTLDSDGTIQAKFPSDHAVRLLIIEPHRDQKAFQSFLVTNWNDGVPEKLTLAPWTDLTVHIKVPIDYRHTKLRLRAIPTESDSSSTSVVDVWGSYFILPALTALEDPVDLDGTRTFHLRVGPGTYRLEAECPLIDVETKNFSVDDSGNSQTIDLEANS